ncbi:Probable glycosyltransferase At5g03795 [Linum grandiflorum]
MIIDTLSLTSDYNGMVLQHSCKTFKVPSSNLGMAFHFRLPNFCQMDSRKWLILAGVLAYSYGYIIWSLLPTNQDSMLDQTVMIMEGESGMAGNALALDASSSYGNLKIRVVARNDVKSDIEDSSNVHDRGKENGFASGEVGLYNDDGELAVDRDVVVDDDDNDNDARLDGNVVTRTSVIELLSEPQKDIPLEQSNTAVGGPLKPNKGVVVKGGFNTSRNNSAGVKKKMRCEMPPKSITTFDEMNNLLARRRRSSRAMRPRWSSARDKEILAAKSQIENAAVLVNDPDLYAPLFRNVSQFKRSYALMERTLKVYVYKDGKKPIFHMPILKGLYASEGWFMKLMEASKQFLAKDPRKAHLFYMPFSSRMLEHTLYVRNSHNRTNLRHYLKLYADSIAAKYPYWNRTGGADHFLVACHDWVSGFKIGRDVSLPETYVRAATNPLRDLGGKPPSQRHILAFYAGSMHGYLRRILLSHWKDKDPDMKIWDRMPLGVASKMNYISHMKSSKYCICPKGYEVNSPRVVESIFYECVPVIISDNFVPPFFEVLDWTAFSIIVAEKDIPNLKQILISIPENRYMELQLGVRKVQRHFLWHANPVKYDLFLMTLHAI